MLNPVPHLLLLLSIACWEVGCKGEDLPSVKKHWLLLYAYSWNLLLGGKPVE